MESSYKAYNPKQSEDAKANRLEFTFRLFESNARHREEAVVARVSR
jgi:hypothetical protein